MTIRTDEDYALEIQELEDVIAYSVTTGGSISCNDNSGCTETVSASTLW